MGYQAIYFIVAFSAILALFIYFIRWLSRRLDQRVAEDTFDRIERVIIGGIVLGVIGMFQPWIFEGYRLGFLLLLFSTLAFIVWSHITPAPSFYGEETAVNGASHDL